MSVGLANKLVKFGNLAEAAKETKKERLDCASFGAGTQVRLPNGFQSIESLIKGQKVSSRHDGNYQDHSQAITSTFNRTADHYYRLVTEKNEIFNITGEHPIWLQGKGWTQAKDIKRADPIATQTGDILVLQNTRINQPLKVYSFSVANTPNYFVGKQGIWVHNAGNECDIYGGGVLTRPTNPPNIREAAQSWPPAKKAKFDVADKFYKDSGATDYDNELRGIDFDNPVEIVEFSKDDKLYRYSYIDDVTNQPVAGVYYYSSKDIDAGKLGFDLKGRKMVEVTLDKPDSFLQSTAADMDSWTVGEDKIFPGGEIQLFNPNATYSSIEVLE